MPQVKVSSSSQPTSVTSLALPTIVDETDSLRKFSFNGDASVPRSMSQSTSPVIADDSPKSPRRALLARTCYDNVLRVRRLNLGVDPLAVSDEPISRRQSIKEVYDVMEREQDAIVLRLMREIGILNAENVALKHRFSVTTPLLPVDYPLRRNSSRSLYCSQPELPTTQLSSSSILFTGHQQRSYSLNGYPSERARSISLLLMKEVSSVPKETLFEVVPPVLAQAETDNRQNTRRNSISQQRLLEENMALRREIMRLQRELDSLRSKA